MIPRLPVNIPFCEIATTSPNGVTRFCSGIREAPAISARPAGAHPELGRLGADPGDEAAELRVIAQPLDRVVLPLQFLFRKRRMNGGVADPVQLDGRSPSAAARH